MTLRSRMASLLLATAMVVGSTLVPTLPATAIPPGCTDEDHRWVDSWRKLVLRRCPSDHPGYRYQARLESSEDGDQIAIYYMPYYNHPSPIQVRENVTLTVTDIFTDYFYGMPGELQACFIGARGVDTCTW